MDEQRSDQTENTMHGDVAGLVVQAGSITAAQVNIGPREAALEPGAGSATVPWSRLAHEVRGRATLVGVLTEQVRSGTGSVMLLYGGGGYGKTTVALSAARVLRDEAAVWWVDATNSTSLAQGLREVAIDAGADWNRVKDAWSGRSSAAELLWRTLNARAERWLLLVDNADDPAVLGGPDGVVDGRGWIRTPASPGTVVITSRDGRAGVWPGPLQRHAVDALSDTDGAAVLLDLAPRAGDLAAAVDLTRRLGGLPLALRLAGRYLAATATTPALPGLVVPRSFAEYGTAWETRLADITVPTDGTILAERELLGKTWELSLDLLVTRGLRLARPILRLASFLAAAPIPYEVLDASVLTDTAIFAGVTPAGLVAVVGGLTGLGLLEHRAGDAETGERDAVVVHPVVRDSCRWQADAVTDAEQYRMTCLALLERATQGLGYAEPAMWPVWRMLLPHCQRAIDEAEPEIGADGAQDLRVARVAHGAADYVDEVGLSIEADRLYRSALNIRRHVLGSEHPDTLATRNNLACVLRIRGETAAAEAEFREVLAARERVLGAEHPDTLVTRQNVAHILRERGELAGAEAQFREVLAARGRLLGIEHPYTLNVRYQLARVLRDRGDPAGAETELRGLIATQRRLQGSEHPATLAARHALACVRWDQGDLSGAEAEFRELVAVEMHALGPEHGLTSAARYELGRVLRERGKPARAEAELRVVIAVRERVLGSGHVRTLAAHYELGRALWERGDPAGAEAELRAGLAMAMSVLGREHRLVAAIEAALDAIKT
ncbi:tetratricopeptide repeat protein [Amycolatopsis sp.]|uniref:tetratricopeptide repeat protein n=1 Tax=Amycolatopsis sp. TaxID=37632 RepID=UPI002D7FF6DB|nr:tetratricopeptide repeat protein [Amycolatopsis sp.]HET6710443.1 tetratricopeptide repeat protein [Amycolatopsis sp.]